jgi:ribonuclease P protein component
VRTRYLEVRLLASLLRYSRVGIIVPKHRHSAVERNRLKRRVREIVRQEVLPSLAGAADVVIRTSPDAYEMSFDSLRRELLNSVGHLMK